MFEPLGGDWLAIGDVHCPSRSLLCDDASVWPRVDGMRAFGLGRPGEMRDRLNALVLAGTKTATAGLVKLEYEPHREVAEHVGERQVALDSGAGVCVVVEITRVETLPFIAVPWEFAEAEGEGFRDIEHWRDGHRSYYRGEGIEIADDDEVVCVWFEVIDSDRSS
jgi:uncharacterized protein YhfF